MTVHDDRSLLGSTRGLRAAEILQPHADTDLSKLYFSNFIRTDIAGIPCFLTRTGYTACPTTRLAQSFDHIEMRGKESQEWLEKGKGGEGVKFEWMNGKSRAYVKLELRRIDVDPKILSPLPRIVAESCRTRDLVKQRAPDEFCTFLQNSSHLAACVQKMPTMQVYWGGRFWDFCARWPGFGTDQNPSQGRAGADVWFGAHVTPCDLRQACVCTVSLFMYCPARVSSPL